MLALQGGPRGPPPGGPACTHRWPSTARPGARVPVPLAEPRPSAAATCRDPSLPSLLGRYLYADTPRRPRHPHLLLDAGGASGDHRPRGQRRDPVSFGQDACGHLYVGLGGGGRSAARQQGDAARKTAPLRLVLEPRPGPRQGGECSRCGRCDEDCHVGARARSGSSPSRHQRAITSASAPVKPFGFSSRPGDRSWRCRSGRRRAPAPGAEVGGRRREIELSWGDRSGTAWTRRG